MSPVRTLLPVLALASGCFMSTVTSIRSGALLEARAADCDLELVSGDSFQPRGHEQLGLVTITFRSLDNLTERDRRQIRNRACSMGGTKLTVNASGGAPPALGGSVQFIVWGPKPRGAAKTPEKF